MTTCISPAKLLLKAKTLHLWALLQIEIRLHLGRVLRISCFDRITGWFFCIYLFCFVGWGVDIITFYSLCFSSFQCPVSGKYDIALWKDPVFLSSDCPNQFPLARDYRGMCNISPWEARRGCVSFFPRNPGYMDRLQPGCAWVFHPESHIPSEIFTMAEIMGY